VAAALDAAWARVAVVPRPGEIAALDLTALAVEPPALQALCLRRLAAAGLEAGALVTRRQAAALEGLAGRRDDAGRAALRGGREAVRGRGRLAVRARRPAHRCAPVSLVLPPPVAGRRRPAPPGGAAPSASAAFCGWAVRAAVSPGAHRRGAGRDARRLSLGFATPPEAVVLRHPRRGERFTPFGRAAATTVARFLAAGGCPADERSWALVVEAEGTPAAVVFVDRAGAVRSRVAQGRRVTQSTKWTLSVALEER